MSDATPVLSLSGIKKSYVQGPRRLDILRSLDLEVQPGELVALLGPSGAGKSTLLHISGLLESPDAGRIVIAGQAIGPMKDAERTAIRRQQIGFVYQYHHLLPEFTALENLIIPQMLNGLDRPTARQRAQQLLELVGLAERLDHRPSQLSGGEQQRVAIVRALVNKPVLLLADEPTGNLDPDTAERVFGWLKKLVRATEVGALIATHNLDLAYSMDRVMRMEEGRLAEASGRLPI